MLKKTLLAISLLALSGAALSAPVANLKVTGNITPPTCTVNGQSEDTIVYNFNVSPDIFPSTGHLTLDGQSQNIEVVCDATTYLTFTSTDERAGTELGTGNTYFGLGTNGADKIGYYTISMENATVKESSEATATKVGVVTGNSAYATSAQVNKTQALGWAKSRTQLVPGQIFAADFVVTPTINSKLKASSGDVQLDGLTVLTFAFGL